MKASATLLALFATSVLAATAIAAPADRAAESAPPQVIKPVVTNVVSPSYLPRSFTREVVNVRFALDENGQPQNVRVISRADREVKKRIVKAFKKWRFDVAALGTSVESKHFVLPLDVIPQA